ncbi:hypothetical protein [Psychrobacter sp. 1176_08]
MLIQIYLRQTPPDPSVHRKSIERHAMRAQGSLPNRNIARLP